jgi:hypothetical protein
MRRWLGVSAAVGSATAAVVAGAAWGRPAEADAHARVQRDDDASVHDCGHDDEVAAHLERSSAGDLLVVRAADGTSNPVEGAFTATTVRLPAQRGLRDAGAGAAGDGVAELRLPVPRGREGSNLVVQVEATFDDGITACTWTARIPRPRG